MLVFFSVHQLENVMLAGDGHVVLVDYGSASEIDAPAYCTATMATVGALVYMAPEIILARPGGRHSDWWSLGVLAHELMTGRSPWSSLVDKDVIKSEVVGGVTLNPSRHLSICADAFVRGLLQRDALTRLGSTQDKDVRVCACYWCGVGCGVDYLVDF